MKVLLAAVKAVISAHKVKVWSPFNLASNSRYSSLSPFKKTGQEEGVDVMTIGEENFALLPSSFTYADTTVLVEELESETLECFLFL